MLILILTDWGDGNLLICTAVTARFVQIMYDLHPSIIKYEHTRDSIHARIQGSPVALLRSEHPIPAVLVGWLVGGVHG